MLLSFDGIAGAVQLVGCDDLVPVLERVAHGWRFRPATSAAREPLITIRRQGRVYRLDSPWLEESAEDTSEAGIVCCLTTDLVLGLAEAAGLPCLHCGAAEFAGRLVVFPNTVRAGKSTLLARLAMDGRRVFADDLLLLDGADGLATGIAPRLRRPLPPKAGPAFAAFVDAHRGPADKRYLYLDLPDVLMAPHGMRLPVGAFVTLEREASGAAELAEGAAGEGLSAAIAQTVSAGAGASDLFARLSGLAAAQAPSLALRYSDLDQAAALLGERFATWPETAARVKSVGRKTAAAAAREPVAGEGPLYLARADVALRQVGDSFFLVDDAGNAIHHLNLPGAGIWNLLAAPTSQAEAVDTLHGAFPDLERRAVRRDVKALFQDLIERGLIVRAE